MSWEKDVEQAEWQNRLSIRYSPKCAIAGCTKSSESGFSGDWCYYHRKSWEKFRRRGVTEEKYLEYASVTNCEICGKSGMMGDSSKNLFVDHEHSWCPDHYVTEWCHKCIRGMLCPGCNTKLAALDKEGWLPKAQQYLADRENNKKL